MPDRAFARRSFGEYVIHFSHTPTTNATPSAAVNCPTSSVSAEITSTDDPINLRGGAGIAYPLAGYVYLGECFEIVGKNGNGTWLQVRTPSLRTGWLLARLTTVHGDLATVPVVSSE